MPQVGIGSIKEKYVSRSRSRHKYALIVIASRPNDRSYIFSNYKRKNPSHAYCLCHSLETQFYAYTYAFMAVLLTTIVTKKYFNCRLFFYIVSYFCKIMKCKTNVKIISFFNSITHISNVHAMRAVIDIRIYCAIYHFIMGQTVESVK